MTSYLSSPFDVTVQGISPEISPLHAAVKAPPPASSVLNTMLSGVPDLIIDDGASTSSTLSATGCCKFNLNGLPFTCFPPHLMVRVYISGSGGVKVTLYLSSSFFFTITSTSPTLSPTQDASRLPLPAPEVSNSISSGAPDSNPLSGSATISTLSALVGSKLIL